MMYSVTCHLIGTTPENPASGWNVTCNTFRSFWNGRLFKRNAQRLGGKRSRGAFIFFSFSMKLQRFFTRCFLYPLFPVGMLSTTPRSQNQIVLFEIGDKVFPFRHLYQVLITNLFCLFKHAVLNILKFLLQRLAESLHTHVELLAIVTKNDTSLLLLYITGTNLNTNRHTLLLPMIVLPSRIVHCSIVKLGSNTSSLEIFQNGFAVGISFFP
mmetsp:Transcript_21230/g.38548  ORF Transcript_21230/g.38548 Transcript_21230/m.38548 type:complete len:212 (-) Transcript_21230:2026-2661(-)